MKLFRREHRHVYEYQKTIMRPSIVSRVPVQVMTIKKCVKCGDVVREITPAGNQQIMWGADQKEWI